VRPSAITSPKDLAEGLHPLDDLSANWDAYLVFEEADPQFDH
jgi:hypothetical protein